MPPRRSNKHWAAAALVSILLFAIAFLPVLFTPADPPFALRVALSFAFTLTLFLGLRLVNSIP